MKASRPHLLVQCIVERNNAHSDVVRHIRAHYGLSRARRRTRIVQRIAESERPERAFRLEGSEILESLAWLHDHGQQCRVWRDNKLLAETPLECEIRNAKSPILI